MAEKQEHPQANLLRALADGDTLEVMISGKWETMMFSTALKEIMSCTSPQYLRIKPQTITIGQYEVEKPMRVAPANGTVYFYITACLDKHVMSSIWQGTFRSEDIQLASGMCWLKREDAELAAKAITELLTGK